MDSRSPSRSGSEAMAGNWLEVRKFCCPCASRAGVSQMQKEDFFTGARRGQYNKRRPTSTYLRKINIARVLSDAWSVRHCPPSGRLRRSLKSPLGGPPKLDEDEGIEEDRIPSARCGERGVGHLDSSCLHISVFQGIGDSRFSPTLQSHGPQPSPRFPASAKLPGMRTTSE